MIKKHLTMWAMQHGQNAQTSAAWLAQNIETTAHRVFYLADQPPPINIEKQASSCAKVENANPNIRKAEVIHFEQWVDGFFPTNARPSKCDYLVTVPAPPASIAFVELTASSSGYAYESKYEKAKSQLLASIALLGFQKNAYESYKQRLLVYAYRLTSPPSTSSMGRAQTAWQRTTRPKSLVLDEPCGDGFRFKAVEYPTPIIL